MAEQRDDDALFRDGAGGTSTTRAKAREAEKNKGEQENAKQWPIPFTNSLLIEGPSTMSKLHISRLTMYGLYEIPLCRDRNDQFRALAILIYENENAHEFVRQKTYNELINNLQIYEKYFKESDMQINYKDHCESIAKIGEEGSLVSLAAACSVFEVKISLIQNTEEDFIVDVLPKGKNFKNEFCMSFCKWTNVVTYLNYTPLSFLQISAKGATEERATHDQSAQSEPREFKEQKK